MRRHGCRPPGAVRGHAEQAAGRFGRHALLSRRVSARGKLVGDMRTTSEVEHCTLERGQLGLSSNT